MAKKKGRKKDDLAFAYRIAGPRGMTKAQVFTAAIESVRMEKKLPPGVSVTWKWRNTAKGKWREGPLLKTVRESKRGGFRALMIRRLTRDALRDAPGFELPAPIRTATPAEIRAIEREETKAEEMRESKRQRGGRELARERETKAKRSAAAAAGWKTRRKNAAAAKKAAPSAARKRLRKRV